MANYGPSEIKTLKEQAAAIGLTIDGRWTPETIAVKLEEAQETKAKEQEREFSTATKIPVLLKKNAFSLDDVKHLKGEIVDIPIEMAKRWISSGVAERADPLPGE